MAVLVVDMVFTPMTSSVFERELGCSGLQNATAPLHSKTSQSWEKLKGGPWTDSRGWEEEGEQRCRPTSPMIPPSYSEPLPAHHSRDGWIPAAESDVPRAIPLSRTVGRPIQSLHPARSSGTWGYMEATSSSPWGSFYNNEIEPDNKKSFMQPLTLPQDTQ